MPPTSSANRDAVFLECMKKLRDEKKKWETAHQTGDKNTKKKAEDNISAYATGAAENVPSFVPDRRTVKKNLSAAGNAFEKKGHDGQKLAWLKKIGPALTACRNVKLASGLAAGGGLVALGCLAEHQPWLMTDGSISEVTQVTSSDGGSTSLLWDENHNHILDHQETISNATGQVINAPHAISDPDILSDVMDGVSTFGQHVWNALF
jgi:hypothetical protein